MSTTVCMGMAPCNGAGSKKPYLPPSPRPTHSHAPAGEQLEQQHQRLQRDGEGRRVHQAEQRLAVRLDEGLDLCVFDVCVVSVLQVLCVMCVLCAMRDRDSPSALPGVQPMIASEDYVSSYHLHAQSRQA